jgi:DNA replication protein DnaC
MIRADLIVIDDVGCSRSPDAAEALFRVVDAADERRSLTITSNTGHGRCHKQRCPRAGRCRRHDST